MKYDISPEEKLMEKAMNETCCIVITDRQGRYRFANRAWSRTMGIDFAQDNIAGKYVRELVADTRINQAMDENRELSGFSTFMIGDRWRQAFSVYQPIRSDAGEVEGGMIVTLFTGDDVDEIKSKTALIMRELQYYKEELTRLKGLRYSLDNIIGKSQQILRLKEDIRKAAHSQSTVLITGETGSGKELVAQSLHGLSPRAAGNFVKVNCASIPKELLESEFFGYERGAFTGANRQGQAGKFEQAHRGSLFLDEISQLSLELQPKLLRAIQEREIERIGGSKSIEVDVRIIAATNKSLEKMVKAGAFRADLYFRLNVVNLEVPPLRQRREDIPLILDALLIRLNEQLGMSVESIPEEVKSKLEKLQYDWPGNVRELQNVLERAMNKAYGERLTWEHFSEYFERRPAANFKFQGLKTLNAQYENAEKDMLLKLLKEKGNKTRVAEAMGISRTALYKKLRKYGINV